MLLILPLQMELIRNDVVDQMAGFSISELFTQLADRYVLEPAILRYWNDRKLF